MTTVNHVSPTTSTYSSQKRVQHRVQHLPQLLRAPITITGVRLAPFVSLTAATRACAPIVTAVLEAAALTALLWYRQLAYMGSYATSLLHRFSLLH
jgi:hypothetical protein